jgi:hypothetical protein
MVRIAKPIDHEKLQELKKKIEDKRYLSNAIQRIAQKLTYELLTMEAEKDESR